MEHSVLKLEKMFSCTKKMFQTTTYCHTTNNKNKKIGKTILTFVRYQIWLFWGRIIY